MTRFALKVIALVSMLIDHLVKADVIHQAKLLEWFSPDLPSGYALIKFIEGLGRLAFPIFAFMIAEGMRHTRSRKRYILRLLLFGVISEFPFDRVVTLIHFHTLPEGMPWYAFTPFTDLNIFFTLAFAAIGVSLTEQFAKDSRFSSASWLPAVLLSLLGALLNVDYTAFGVLMIYAAYFPKDKQVRLAGMAAVLAALYLVWINEPWMFFASCVSLLLLAFYNGQRGRKCKWLFYIFYPAHLAAILLLRIAFPG